MSMPQNFLTMTIATLMQLESYMMSIYSVIFISAKKKKKKKKNRFKLTSNFRKAQALIHSSWFC